MSDDTALQPLLTHLYGPGLGQVIAEAARAQEAERVIVLGSDATGPKGWAVLEQPDQGDGDDGSLHDPFPVIDFQSWQGEDHFRQKQADGWDVIIGFPPQGHLAADELTRFLEAARDTAGPSSRAVLLMVAASLSRGRPDVREALLKTGEVRSITYRAAPPGLRRPGLETSVEVAAVVWAPSTSPNQPRTRVVETAGPGDEGTSFEIQLQPDQSWSVPALDPDRAKKLTEWASAGNAQPLSAVADLPSPDTDFEGATAVLLPKQITRSGIDLNGETREPDAQKDGRLTSLQLGDIVGRTVGEPHWWLVTERDLGLVLVASKQVTVIRSHAVAPRYLLAFLRSDAAARQLEAASAGLMMPRVSTRALREILVPVLEVADSALRDNEAIDRLRDTSSELTEELDQRYRAAFDKPNAQLITATLADAAGDAAMAADLLERVKNPLHRARQFLPHPLARILRSYANHQSMGSPESRHQDLLRFGETAIILLGAVGLAYATGPAGQEIDDEWAQKFQQGGVSLGTWLRAANVGAEAARRAKEPLGGLDSALSTNSPLNSTLNEFLTARNDTAHGAGPRSPYEYEQATLKLDELMRATVSELGPLARSDWFVVERLTWVSDRQVFVVHGRSLTGDHPDFENWASERTEPLESEVVHVRLGTLDLPLGGFCVLRTCSICLHEELCYPDHHKQSLVRLRSLDRGHQSKVALTELRLPLRG